MELDLQEYVNELYLFFDLIRACPRDIGKIEAYMLQVEVHKAWCK